MSLSYRVGVALLLAVPVLAQQTWVVALQPGPGVDFTDIPPAVAAAAPGDRIEVYGSSSYTTPTYSSFVVDKELDIEALEAAMVRSIRVEWLPAGQTARIAGFRCHPMVTATTPDNGLFVRNCAGTVLLRGLDVVDRSADYHEGIGVQNSTSVVAHDLILRGSNGGLAYGGAALVVDQSHCSLVRATLVGGSGGSSASSAAGDRGGPGVSLVGGTLLAADCEVSGGAAGWGWAYCADGGPAVAVASGTAGLWHSTLTGGPGIPGASADGAAVDGLAHVGGDCTVVGVLRNGAVVAPAITLLAAPGDAHIGDALDLQLTGPVATVVLLGIDDRGAATFVPGFAEPLWLTSTWQPVAVHVLRWTQATLSFTIPNAPTLAQRSFWFQAAAFEPRGRTTLTPVAVARIAP